MPILLEICVDDGTGLTTAVTAGADRIELCAALSVGGLTPSPGLMAMAAESGCPTYAMIRPRAGDFIFSDAEQRVMEGDIDAAHAAGLAGIVLGASLPDGRLAPDVLAPLASRARGYGLGLTLHRAFDLVPDFAEAIDLAVSLGFERILTSGGARTAPTGLPALREIVALARGRISIMPGSGIAADNAAQILSLGVDEIHASGSAPLPAASGKVAALGFDIARRKETSATAIRTLKAALV